MVTNTIESITNSISDIVIAFVAFIVSYLTFAYLQVDNESLVVYFALITTTSLFLDYFGWKLFLKKKLDKTKDTEYVSVHVSNRKVFLFLSVVVTVLVGSFIII